MLPPRYLDGVSDEIADIYAQLETDILTDMARRIARLGKITESTKWQAQLLHEQGALKKDIDKILKGYAKPIRDEIKAAYNDAVVKSNRNDNKIFRAATGRTVSDQSAQLMLANMQKTYNDLSRLTITTAATSEAQFVNQANAAYMQVASGAFDYDSAMKNACENLAKDGVTCVQYRNGTPVKFTIESAVRMNILTGINQTAANITLNNCEELDCDLVETSAHIGARPEHEEWQGKIFSVSGKSDKYPPFSVCGLGEVTGICGINCRHSFYPYFEGLEEHYTEKELDEMANVKVSYNGQTMTRYEGEQKLRGIERNIRKYKREAETLAAGGVDDTAARIKLGEWQARARDFTKQTGIERDRAREFVGTVSGVQPKPILDDYYEAKRYEKHAAQIFNTESNYLSNVEQGAAMSFDKADNGNVNPRYGTTKGYSENCQSAVVTFEARLRGFDVEVLPNVKGSKLETLSHDTRLAWKTADGKTPEYIYDTKANTVDKMLDFVDRTVKTNERYTLRGSYKNKDYGHIINVFRENNGILVYYDPQSDKILDDFGRNELFRLMNKGKTPQTAMQLLRVDNLQFNKDIVDYILTRRNKSWKKP